MQLSEWDKVQAAKIKPNTKIRVLSPEHSRYVQELAFELGAKWIGQKNKDVFPDGTCIFLYIYSSMNMDYGTSCDVFDYSDKKEIFIELPPTNINAKVLTEKVGSKFAHYYKDVSKLKMIDVYRVCDLFNVNDPSGNKQHAIKKLLCSGQRGVKDERKDIEEAISTLQRKLEMMKEDEGARND